MVLVGLTAKMAKIGIGNDAIFDNQGSLAKKEEILAF